MSSLTQPGPRQGRNSELVGLVGEFLVLLCAHSADLISEAQRSHGPPGASWGWEEAKEQ